MVDWMRRNKRWMSAMLALVLVLSQAITVMAADNERAQNVSGTRSSVIDAVYNTVSSAVYSEDFENSVTKTTYGGFTTTGATLGTTDADIGGNTTSKLSFNMTNQSGGRVATKKLAKPVTGSQVLMHFDWYPGLLNDKGKNPDQNAGDFRLFDSSGITLFTIRNTRDLPLAFFAGSQAANNTGFTNPDTWYTVDIFVDLLSDQLIFGMKDKSTGVYEEHTISLKPIVFDGFLDTVKLVGVRTSGNNITWTTYLDNLSVHRTAVPDNTIIMVNKLPYHTVYVDQTTADVQSVGLPQQVTLTLANNTKATAAVAQWSAADKAWNPHEPGVYKFTGTVVAPDGLSDTMNLTLAVCYVYNRMNASQQTRSAEWLDRGAVALKAADEGIFISWRLLATEYAADVKFNIYRGKDKLNAEPLTVTNYKDAGGEADDVYTIETLRGNLAAERTEVTASAKDYLSFPLQKPAGGTTQSGDYTYSANDASVGDLDGDGQYEMIVKWYPSNAIDSSQTAMTGPTIFDAYKLDGTLLWRMNMGRNLTSGAHYNQFIVADFDQDGKSEMMIKTADATTVYGVTNGMYDSKKVISVIGDAGKDGAYVNDENNNGHIIGGPEYFTVFDGLTGKAIDTVNYAFPLGSDGGASYGDTWWNRSDRFLAGLAYLDGKKPSAVFGRGYYARTTYVAYSLVNGKLVEEWKFDSALEGQGGGLGFHSVSTGDVDNDGKDEIVAGSLTLDDDGSILYTMDGNMQREIGSHGDALHLGAFDPDRDGLQVFAVHEVPEVASVELHDAATGETLQTYYAYKDTGRGLIANITPSAGHEFWGAAGSSVAEGGAIYNVQTGPEIHPKPNPGPSQNFTIYWDGDLLQELMDGAADSKTSAPIIGESKITKYNPATKVMDTLRKFPDTTSSNGTKATPTLQADILGDWREEVVLPALDSTEMRIYSTTIPTDYRIYTLMHDPVYRNAIAAQNTAYNQPPHLSFYLGEDNKATVAANGLKVPNLQYTKRQNGAVGNYVGAVNPPSVQKDGSVEVSLAGQWNATAKRQEVSFTQANLDEALSNATAQNGGKKVILKLTSTENDYLVQLPLKALQAADSKQELVIASKVGEVTLNSSMLSTLQVKDGADIGLFLGAVKPEQAIDKAAIDVSFLVDGQPVSWSNPEAPAQVVVPYKPAAGEDAEKLAVTYLADAMARTPVYNGRYHAEKEAVVFSANHFSTYAVTYSPKSFGDMGNYGWAKQQVEVLAAKGIINGTSDTERTFEPEASVSRADFTVLLVNTLGLAAETTAAFKDVLPQDYYYGAVATAKQLGIAQGDEEGSFHPGASVSRQDMMVLTARAMKAAGISLDNGKAGELDAFPDQGTIAGYAREAAIQLVSAKLIAGDEAGIHPLGEATRAETAAFMYRIYNLAP